jgi:hypothetical protein
MSKQKQKQTVEYLKPKAPSRSGGAGSRAEGKKKDHTLTVSYVYFKEKKVPFIRLSGEWLARQGFDLGKKIIVREQSGQLVLQLAEEAGQYES